MCLKTTTTMKTINIIFVLIFFTACVKQKDKVTTIEGELMASCDTPAANKSGFILTEDGLLSGPGISLSFTTNENGYFKVTHKGKEDLNVFTVRVQGSSDVLKVSGLPGDKKDLGKVYINPPVASYYLHLEVGNSSYTELDTLHYRNAGYPSNGKDPWIKKPGPFLNGIIDTVPVAINPGAFPITFGSSTVPRIRVRYHINEYDSWTVKEVYIPTPHCINEYQTVTLVID
jgi:hypothetical protein